MALRKSVQTSQGFFASDAYHRVEGVSISPKQSFILEDVEQQAPTYGIVFQVRSYKDASGVPAFADQSFSCVFDLAGENPIKQAYEYLKKQIEFENATDC